MCIWVYISVDNAKVGLTFNDTNESKKIVAAEMNGNFLCTGLTFDISRFKSLWL